jgi:hypothetical protein
MKNGTAYGTTEYTEKDSVSSRKKIKRQRHRGVGNRLVGRGRGCFGGIEGLITTRAQRGGNDNSLHFLKLHNFSGFSVVIF